MPLPGGSIIFMLENILQTAAIYCKMILILTGGKGMYGWNSVQIDPAVQFIDYMVFQESIGSSEDDDDCACFGLT